jgi:hypothetical protein
MELLMIIARNNLYMTRKNDKAIIIIVHCIVDTTPALFVNTVFASHGGVSIDDVAF